METRLERGKRMKKKGFTLIELLAVIVILAIIALIAVPTVMNIISKANKSAFKDSAYGVLKAGENYYMGELLNAQGMTSDKVFDFSKDTSELEINGSKPTNGKMIVNTNGKVAMAIHNGRHCVTKGFNDDDVTISDDIENCKIPGVVTIADLAVEETFTKVDGSAYESEDDPATVTKPACLTNGQECAAGTPVAIQVNKTETYKFYVLSDTRSEVTLIMDRNLYSAEDLANNTHNVAWISEEDYVDAGGKNWFWTDKYEREGNNEKGPLTALRILKERTSGWTNIPEITISTFDDDAGGEYELHQLFTMHARLPMHSELYDLYNRIWLMENTINRGDNDAYGYWASTASVRSNDSAWVIIDTGDEYDIADLVDNDTVGLRPVITLSK